MKYFITCYKVPISYDIFEIGKFYAYIQTILSYNSANGEDFYKIDKYQVKDNDILFHNNIYPHKYKNKFLTSFIPKNCDLVYEDSINSYPNSYTKFSCPHNQKIGYGELITHISKIQYDKQINNGIPEYILQFIEKKKKLKIKHIDLSRYGHKQKTSGNDNNEIFIYTLVKAHVNHFFKFLAESLAGPASLSVIKSGLIRVIQEMNQWENLKLDSLCDMIQGKGIRIAEIEDFPIDNQILQSFQKSKNMPNLSVSIDSKTESY